MSDQKPKLNRRQLLVGMGGAALTLAGSPALPRGKRPDDLHYASLASVGRMLQAKEISPVEVLCYT